MKMPRYFLFLITSILVFLTTVLLGLGEPWVWFGQGLSLLYLGVWPGILLVETFGLRFPRQTEYVLYSIGFSLAFLLIVGLLLNTFLPLIGIVQPLALPVLLLFFDTLFLFLGGYLFFNGEEHISLPKIKLNETSLLLFLMPLGLVALSVIGAVVMNMWGIHDVTLWFLLAVVGVVVIISFLKNPPSFVYPWVLFCIGCGLLLMYSLRSSHIIGWDIHLEYEVFQLTNMSKQWILTKLPNPYNACLSITILPTIFASFLKIDPEYIYKILMQIFFALTPVGIYALTKRLGSSSMFAFLTSLVFVFQTWFSIQMSSLIRQEIAFLFFSLILLTLFNTDLPSHKRWLVLGIFGIAMVLSHYSTVYIWLVLMLLYKITRFLLKAVVHVEMGSKPIVSNRIFIFFVVATLTWNFLLTNTTQNAQGAFKDLQRNIYQIFSLDLYKNGLDQILFREVDFNSPQTIERVYRETTRQYQNYTDLQLYTSDTYASYIPQPVLSPKVPAPYPWLFESTLRLSQLVKIGVEIIFPLLGLFFLLKTKNLKAQVWEYTLLGTCTLPLVAALIFIPGIKEAYNLTRLHLQSLFFLAFSTVFGGFYMLSRWRLKQPVYLTLVLTIFFLFTSGFVFQLTGGEPFEHLNTYGNSFDKFYVFDGEVKAAKWLKQKDNGSDLIQADIVANTRLYSYGQINRAIFDIFPSTIDKNAYVYLDTTNVQKQRAFKSYDIDFISYTYPVDFLNEQKDLLYSNPYARVYK